MHFKRTKIIYTYLLSTFFVLISYSICPCLFAQTLVPVKIAVITSETGIAVDDGIPIIQSAKMTIDEINKNGGLLGKPVQLIFIDNKGSVIGSAAAAKKAVKLNVTGVIGASWSSHSLAMATILQKAKIPMITPASTDPKITKIGDYIFRVCFTDEFQGKIMAKFARNSLKASTAAVMQNINEQYSLTLSHYFITPFIKSGGDIILKGNYTNKCVNFLCILNKIKTLKPDVVFLPGYSRDSGLIIHQAGKMGIETTFLGGDGWSTKIFKYAGEYLKNGYAAAPWYKGLQCPESRHMQNLFYKTFKKPVYNGVIALTYDAIKIFCQAVRKAGSLDREMIRDILARTVDFHGATGNITFDGTGDPIGKKAFIMKFSNHTYRFVKSVKEKTIKIAAIYALTGRASQVSRPSLHGIISAVNQINDLGGIQGKKLQVYIIDNKSTPIGSKIAAEKAVSKKIIAIIGSLWSSNSIEVAKVAQAHKIPMISTMSTNPKLTQIGNYIFRVCFTDNFQGKILASFAVRTLKAKTAVIFTDITSDYSMGLSNEIRKNFQLSGGRILFDALYKSDLSNYKHLILQTKQYNPDVIFFTGHDESGFLAYEAQVAGIKAIPLGGDGWNQESFMNKGGKYIKRGFFCTHWSRKSKNPVSLAFTKKYKNRSDLSSSFALAYDAVFLLADAINRAHSLDKDKIRMALEHTKSFHGVTGDISFDKNRDPVKNAVIKEIRNGQVFYFETIKP